MGSDLSVSDDFTESTVRRFLAQARVDFEQRWQTVYTGADFQWNDYEWLKKLGSGAFGRVILIEEKKSQKHRALKIMQKEKILRLKIVHRALSEKQLMYSIDFQFIPKIFFHSQDPTCLYMALEFVAGGDVYNHLRRVGPFQEETSTFYAAQICMALEYLHAMDIVYRDLKPENTLIDRHGYIKLGDFGCAKRAKGRTWTLSGTPDYIAPEIILARPYGKAVDWWSFGVFIYEMCAGFAPFESEDEYSTFQKIVSGVVSYPSNFSQELKDLISNLLKDDISKRYGNLRKGVFDIVNHSWFQSTNFHAIYTKTVEAPFIPPPPSFDWDEKSSLENVQPAVSDDTLWQAFKDF